MKKLLIVGLCLSMMLITAFDAKADTLRIGDINSFLYGTTVYGGAYVGPLQASIQGVNISDGITCVDINTTTYIPTSFDVYIGKLTPVDISQAKFASQDNALFKYQEAAALLGQMSSHVDQIGAIQYAIWLIFDPTHTHPDDSRITDWLNWAGQINVGQYNFSSVRIYTPTGGGNQEFMSGAAVHHTPIPGVFLLLVAGLARLAAYARKCQRTKALVSLG
jgi:hypothetical protein